MSSHPFTFTSDQAAENIPDTFPSAVNGNSDVHLSVLIVNTEVL